MGAVRMYRNTSLPSPGTMAADQVRFVKVGSSYIQYVIDNSGVAIPPAVIAHTHSISDVTGLQTALDDKSNSTHTHANATTSVAGFMSATDKTKLDGLSNYTHPNSGVSAGTYRSVTVDAQGHVTGGTNPTTLAGYGITQRYVSLDPADGFATPVQSSYDLNTIAYTSYGYAATATNRPTGAAANGYFSTNAIDGTSFFQTFANPTVQDAFFYRRKNTSTIYAWLQVASREWVTAQAYLKGTGTAGKVPIFTESDTVGDSLLSISGVNVTANQGQFVSDIAPASGPRGMALQNGTVRWVIGKFNAETGSNAGSDLVYQRYSDTGVSLGTVMTISRATGDTVFGGTVSGATPTASGHLTTKAYVDSSVSGISGFVPTSRTLTINGTTFDLSANRSWTVSGGLTGSGVDGYLASWSGGNLTQSVIQDTGTFMKVNRDLRINNNGTKYFVEFSSTTSAAGFAWFNADESANYGMYYLSDGLLFSRSGSQMMRFNTNATIEFLKSTGVAPFIVNSTTLIPNLNADMIDGVHASSLVQTSRTLTINGTTFDLSTNRSWTISAGIGGSGTAGKIPKLATSTTLADSILTESGINITAAGQFISDIAHNSNVRGFGLQASGVNRWVFGKAGTESGSDSGSDFTLWSYSDAGSFVREPLRISRASGNMTLSGSITVSGGNSNNWNTAYTWGNHASAGYVTLSYLSTNYYDKAAINSMVSGYVPDSRTVLGTGSIQGGGNLGANRSFNLYGDQDTPGANKYYGTDGSGGKGWYSLPSGGGVPTSRVLTINGVSYDLSMDRSWSISTGVSGSGTSFRTAVWNSSSSLVASSIMSDTGSQITISGHLIISGGEFGLGLLSGDPSSPTTGTMYFNTSLGRPRYYNGSSWVTI